MHRLKYFLPIFTLAFIAGCGPTWIVDPGVAEKIARQENKPLLLYFKSWDSSQHRHMRMRVFPDAAVAREMKDTVNAELEFGFFPDYRNRYGVKMTQVCVMCAPDGHKVGEAKYVNPVPSPQEFAQWLQATKAEARRQTAPPQPKQPAPAPQQKAPAPAPQQKPPAPQQKSPPRK